ncbi:MAG: DNA polymerase III subunit delta, partial [Candidatus Cloacimonetes bacterium]|nr:DNA polymerase III subunit delta [Candidatus Cloacimonadota bacterium]
LRNFDQLDNNDKNLLADYLVQPLSTSILILLAEKCDRRIAACKKIFSSSLCVECKPPYDQRDISRWLQAELRNRRLQMSPDAINTFAGYIEPDYLIASNELEKLIILTRGRQIISTDDVLECVGRSRTGNIYELQNALGQKKLNTALTILENMLDSNESAVFIVTMLTYFFITLWKIQLLRRNKVSDRMISEQYLPEIYPIYRRDYLQYAADYPLASLCKIHLLLLQADTDLKSLDLDDRIILEMLVFRIIQPA